MKTQVQQTLSDHYRNSVHVKPQGVLRALWVKKEESLFLQLDNYSWYGPCKKTHQEYEAILVSLRLGERKHLLNVPHSPSSFPLALSFYDGLLLLKAQEIEPELLCPQPSDLIKTETLDQTMPDLGLSN